MNKGIKLIPIREMEVLEDEMLNFITAGLISEISCNPNDCGKNSGTCSGINECKVNSGNCTGTNKCQENESTAPGNPSDKT